MPKQLTVDALAHLRHELRTPINHVLGYTDLLLEDSPDRAADDVLILRQLNHGGHILLDCIQRTLGGAGEPVTWETVRMLEESLRPEAQRLLDVSNKLVEKCSEGDDAEIAGDLGRISEALRRLMLMARSACNGELEQDCARAGSSLAPAARSTENPSNTLSQTAESADVPAARILVAEDIAMNRDLLRRRLEKENYHVTEAQNGLEALAALEAEDFDLLLLDLMMPEMDGFQTLERLKADERLRYLPVIMISAIDEVTTVVRCIDMGAEDFLPKPFDPILLRARVGASIERKRLRDADRQKTKELETALGHLKESQRQLIVQEKMASLGLLTAGIAHEIKNPLNFVTNFAAVSSDMLGELKSVIEGFQGKIAVDDLAQLDEIIQDLTANLGKIRQHGNRADNIVRGMLAHSRSGPGQPEKADLNAIVSDAVNLAYHGLRAKDTTFNIALEQDHAADLPLALVYAQDISRVIVNLVNNGCYAAHQKKLKAVAGYRPTLWTSTSYSEENFTIRIRDNGTGIPATLLDRIFNPFFTTKPTGSGTGLGLSLSYQIVVDQHKGKISVDTVEGEYTEFQLTIPASL